MHKVNKQRQSMLTQWISTIIYLFIMVAFIIAGRIYSLFTETENLPVILGTALLLGHLFFGISLLITNRNHINAIKPFFDHLKDFLPFQIKNIKRVLFTTVYIIIEELFWRGYLQSFFFNSIFLIPLVTGLFTLVHFYKFRMQRADLLSVLEFYLYILMLSYVFYATQSIYAALLIHFIRNMYAEYWRMLKRQYSKQAVLGGAETAVQMKPW